LLFLAALEESLRLLGYGKDYSLLKRQGAYYLLNPDYPAKFFSQNDISIPEFIPQKIPVNKAPDEVRIICLGGSTTEGFPFEVNINFPHFLQCYLQKCNPEKHWRVINLGLSAINSHSVRNMASQIPKLKPDAILIYMGHNEFYGALGLASNSVIASNANFVQFYLWLKNLRLYQLMEKIIFKFKPKSEKHPATLMAAMIRKSRIVPGSSLYRKTLNNFKENLNAIVKIFSASKTPVFISTLVSNLKDQEPLGYPNPDSSIAHYATIRQALNAHQ
jgi:lysophospholipase L1-like esterase